MEIHIEINAINLDLLAQKRISKRTISLDSDIKIISI